jgi:hypothetical protein
MDIINHGLELQTPLEAHERAQYGLSDHCGFQQQAERIRTDRGNQWEKTGRSFCLGILHLPDITNPATASQLVLSLGLLKSIPLGLKSMESQHCGLSSMS